MIYLSARKIPALGCPDAGLDLELDRGVGCNGLGYANFFLLYEYTWDIRHVFLLLDRAGAFSASPSSARIQLWPGAPTT